MFTKYFNHTIPQINCSSASERHEISVYVPDFDLNIICHNRSYDSLIAY